MVKTYGQWCGLAKALDVIGERWSLLVVRELLDGPKRYTDLRDGIPGIATDVLAARLKDLEEWGVVAKRTLPPPAASKVYELTDRGRELGPSVRELTRWGMKLLGGGAGGGGRGDAVFRPHWLAMGLRTMLREAPPTGVHLEIDFDLGDEVVRIRVADGDLRAVDNASGDPDVTVRADLETLTALSAGVLAARDAFGDGRIELTGSRHGLRTYRELFPRP